MKYIDFKTELERAKIMILQNPDYWQGYRKGLSRQYFGEEFSTEEEHWTWVKKAKSSDKSISEQGRGYLDGLNFE